MYITLAEAKRHLNVDSSFNGDDVYITYLVEVCTQAVENHICQPLDILENSDNQIPAPLRHAILLLVGDYYQSRESNAYGVSPVEVPHSYEYLLSPYINYSGENVDDMAVYAADEICRHMIINELGYLTIDPDYVDHCNCLHGLQGRIYRATLVRMCEGTHLDENGNVIISA